MWSSAGKPLPHNTFWRIVLHMSPARIRPLELTSSEDPDWLAPRCGCSVLSHRGAGGLEVDRSDASGEAFLGVMQPRPARHRPDRDSSKQVAALWSGICVCRHRPVRVAVACPLPTPIRGCAWAHSSAPAGSAPSASRDLRDRCRQGLIDSKIESSGELRLPQHRGLHGNQKWYR